MKVPRPLVFCAAAAVLVLSALAVPVAAAGLHSAVRGPAVPNTTAPNVLGDFNGDGVGDLAVGVPLEDLSSATDAGGVNVIYGAQGTGLTSTGNQFITESDVGNGVSPATNDYFGFVVAAADFNGDGYSDLAVGAPFATEAGRQFAGVVYAFPGSSSGLVTGNATFIDEDNIPGHSSQAGANFGYWLASGDFNENGFADLAIGTPGQNIGTRKAAGAVSVAYGSSTGLTTIGAQFWSQNSSGIVDASQTDDFFGLIVAAGDFNGDGAGDLVAGVPGESIGTKAAAGAVNVIYGSSSGLTSAGNQLWSQDSPGIANASEANDFFGATLATGDMNGDGKADLAVGVQLEDTTAGIKDAGTVNVIYGSGSGLRAAGSQIWNRHSSAISAGDQYGTAIAIGDYNGNGYADMAVGIPGEDVGASNAGAVNVVFGSASGLTTTGRQNWTQTGLSSTDGAQRNDFFGDALSQGDFNQDGKADLAVGVPLENIGSIVDAGAVAVIYGNTPRLSATGNQFWHQNSAGIADSAEAGDLFGFSLASGPNAAPTAVRVMGRTRLELS
jgi:hypothetical protein